MKCLSSNVDRDLFAKFERHFESLKKLDQMVLIERFVGLSRKVKPSRQQLVEAIDGPGIEWRTVPFATQYEVSSIGQLRRTVSAQGWRAGRILRPRLGKRGYLDVKIRRDGAAKSSNHGIHVLVCTAFHGPKPTPDHIVAHWDGEKENNRADNLRWATHTENHADRLRHGTDNGGERNWNSILSDADVELIRADTRKHAEIAAQYGVSRSHISSIKCQSWRRRPTSRPAGAQIERCA